MKKYENKNDLLNTKRNTYFHGIILCFYLMYTLLEEKGT